MKPQLKVNKVVQMKFLAHGSKKKLLIDYCLLYLTRLDR